MCIGKFIFRTALIGGLAVGGLALMAPDHFRAGFAQVKGKVQSAMDSVIDDPVAIRRQLQSLAEELPTKIGELRAEIAEVDSQIAQMTRDTEVAQRVVVNTGSDLEHIATLVARADEARATQGGVVQVRFAGQRMDVNRAKQEFVRVSKLREQYQDRIALNERDLGYLTQQRERLGALLENLETEYGTIETQMWQIDRKIDAIARSERLADAIEERQEAFTHFGTFDSKTLEQIQSKIREWEIETTARLEALDARFAGKDYEKQAETELDFEQSDDDGWFEFPGADESDDEDSVVLGPTIIE